MAALNNIMLDVHSNTYNMVVSRITWTETKEERTQSVLKREYEGFYKGVKVIKRTFQERFRNGVGWKRASVMFLCDGGVFDSTIKLGSYLKDFDRAEAEAKAKLRYK